MLVFFIVLFTAVMTVTVITQVLTRYVVFRSIPWTEELSRYLLIWVTMLGAAAGYRQKVHIGIQFFRDKLPPNVGKIVEIITVVIVLLCSLVIARYGFTYSSRTIRQLAPAMRLSMRYFTAAIPVGMVFFLIYSLEEVLHIVGLVKKDVQISALYDESLVIEEAKKEMEGEL